MEQLAELPPDSWMQIFEVVSAREFEMLANLVSVMHPKSPKDVQRAFLRAAKAAMRSGSEEEPIWADPRRFKRWLAGQAGVGVRETSEEGNGVPSGPDSRPDVQGSNEEKGST